MEKIINVQGIRPNGVTLCIIDDKYNKRVPIVMEPITKEEEHQIDKSSKYYGNIIYERKDNVVVKSTNIYLYGEVNFNDEEDIYQIEHFNLVGPNSTDNIMMSNFDYNNGTITTKDGRIGWYNTFNAIKWFKFCYCILGKPDRVIVYKNPIIKR